MIFFLSYLVFASALEYPFWGDWRYGPEMMTYSHLISQPGCVTTSECASLLGRSFNGAELEVCLKSAKKGCQFITEPSVSEMYLTYRLWKDNGEELVPPSWATGCNTSSTTGGTIYAGSIQKVQDHFATLMTYDLEVKGGYFQMTFDGWVEDQANFDLYLGNYPEFSNGCSNLDLNDMTKFDLTDKWDSDGWYIYIPFDDIIGKGNVLISHDKRTPSNNKTPSYVNSMRFESERVLAYFKASGSANSDSAQSIISLSLLSLAFVTLMM